MADRSINDLTAASEIKTTDLFVLQQDGTAKSLTGALLVSELAEELDGHGGIASITWTESGTAGNGKTHTGTITFSDGSTSTVAIQDGYKGNTGNAAHVYFKYASDLPTADSDMGSEPDNYIGIYSGDAAIAPTHYTDYTWFLWKGNTGNTGTAAKLLSPTITYLASASGTEIPEGNWSSDIPIVVPGNYLWTRTRLPWNDGTTTVAYSVSRFGIDGEGAVSSVNSIGPDPNGNVVVAPSNIIMSDTRTLAAHMTDVETAVDALDDYKPIHFSISLTSLPRQVDDARITANMRVLNPVFGTPSNVRSAVSYTTGATNVVFSGTLAGTTTFDFDLMKVDT